MKYESTITDRYALYNGDCVEVTKQMPDNSIDFMIFSPPFANLYIYSDDLRDMGNCKNTDEFFEQFVTTESIPKREKYHKFIKSIFTDRKISELFKDVWAILKLLWSILI